LQRDLENRRRLVRIVCEDNKKTVYCEALYADPHYWERWTTEKYPEYSSYPRLHDEKKADDARVIFINGWYRKLLGIQNVATAKKAKPVKMNVSIVKNSLFLFLVVWLYKYPFNHPQNLVRLTAMIAIIGLGLGLIRFGLGLWGLAGSDLSKIIGQHIWDIWKGSLFWAGIVLFLLGIGVFVSGPAYTWFQILH
jgi:hypothetical protein